MSGDGVKVFVSSTDAHSIRMIDTWTGVVTTVAGGGGSGNEDGIGAQAKFSSPHGLASTLDGKTLYIADTDNDQIRMLDVATGVVTTPQIRWTNVAEAFVRPTSVVISSWGPAHHASAPDSLLLPHESRGAS